MCNGAPSQNGNVPIHGLMMYRNPSMYTDAGNADAAKAVVKHALH